MVKKRLDAEQKYGQAFDSSILGVKRSLFPIQYDFGLSNIYREAEELRYRRAVKIISKWSGLRSVRFFNSTVRGAHDRHKAWGVSPRITIE
jgi:hypothetical protein